MTGNRFYEPYSTEVASDWNAPIDTVDHAIDEALSEAALQDGWNGIPDLNDMVWNRIASDVQDRVLDDLRNTVEDMAVSA